MRPVLALLRKDLLTFFRSPASVVLSFAVPFFLIYLFGQIFGVNRKDTGPTGIWLGIEVLPHLPLPALVSVFAAAACTSFGMLLSAVSPTPEAANGLATFPILLMCAVGGAWFPLSLLPEFIQQFGRLTLVYWAMEGFSAVLWARQGLLEILPVLGVLTGITAAVMTLAIWGFNRGKLFN